MKSIIDFIDSIVNSQINGIYREYNLGQWNDDAKLTENQQIKLKKLLEHARKNVHYYRELFKNREIDIPLQSIPILSRELIWDNFNQLKAENYNISDMHMRKTGGSTGHPMKLYLDNRLKVVSKAVEMLGDYEWKGLSRHCRKVILWGLVPDGRSKGLDTKPALWLKRILSNRCKFYLANVNEEDLSRQIKYICKASPELIFGYVSSVKKAAEYIKKHNIKGIRPKAVITTAETLTESVKIFIEEVFCARVYNRYAAAEVGLIASECSEGSLHIHSSRLIVEVVKDGRSVEPGQTGELLVTDLDNYAFPLIRYAIGDIGVLSPDNCVCGRKLPILKEIMGRTCDYIYTASGEKFLAMFMNRDIRKDNDFGRVRQVQYIQEEIDRLVIRIVKGAAYTEETENLIKERLTKRYFQKTGMNIQFDYVEQIQPTLSGKIRMFVSHLRENERG